MVIQYFFPKNSSTLAGSSALDVLKKTPGILVDGNDNISIGGRNGVLIIFNGKPTYMKTGRTGFHTEIHVIVCRNFNRDYQ